MVATCESYDGALAQLGEHLLCKQRVGGSIPPGSTNFRLRHQQRNLYENGIHSDLQSQLI